MASSQTLFTAQCGSGYDNNSSSIQSTESAFSTPPSAVSSLSKTSIYSPCSDLLDLGDEVSNCQDRQALETMPPMLSSVGDPITIALEGELKSSLELISSLLAMTDPEAWDKRLEALTRFERVIAGGSIRLHHSAENHNPWIISTLRKMPMEAQIEDLRSIITGHACKVIAALAYELRDQFAPLAEKWIQSILRLSISGVRVMAQQGMNCLVQITSFRSSGYPRLLPLFCDGCTGKQHQNYKRSCVLALTNALRVWMCEAILAKSVKDISKAIMSATTDRDPLVREDGRKAFWALKDRFESSANETLNLVDSTSQKHLQKVKQEAIFEWEEGGYMNLISRGHDVTTALLKHQNTCATSASDRGAIKATRTTMNEKSVLKNGGGALKSAVRTAHNSRLNIAVLGTSLKSSTTKRNKFPTSAAKKVHPKTLIFPSSAAKMDRPKVLIPESSDNLNVAIASTPKIPRTKKNTGHNENRITLAEVLPEPPEQKITHHNLTYISESVLMSSQISAQSIQHGSSGPFENMPAKAYTLNSFLSAMSDHDWSVKESALSLVASSFSSQEEISGCLFDIDSFILAGDVLQQQFVRSLAKSINDDNLCVSMSSLEAVYSILLNKRGRKIFYNYLHILLLPLLNKRSADTDRIVNDCIEALQNFVSTPSSIEATMEALVKLLHVESLEQLSDSAQLRIYDILILFAPHAKMFLDDRHNLTTIIGSTIVFASKVSLCALCEVLTPFIESIYQAVGAKTVVSELIKVRNEDFMAAVETSDVEWTRAVQLAIINANQDEAKADATSLSNVDGYDGSIDSITREEADSTSLEIGLLDKNDLDNCQRMQLSSFDDVCLNEHQLFVGEQQRLHVSENTKAVLRSPLASENINTFTRESGKSKFQTPESDRVLRYMTRPSPISTIKYCKESIDTEVRSILKELDKCQLSHELYAAMQSLLQLAKDEEFCHVWDFFFVEILRSLLKGIINTPATNIITDDVAEARHLYLQGLRVLLKFHAHRFENFVVDVIQHMIQCSSDSNSYIVHAAERVLESMVATLDPSSCLAAIRPYTESSAHQNSILALRTMTKLVRRLDRGVVKEFLPALFPSLKLSIADDSVDTRKVVVFLIVELTLIFDEIDLFPHLDQLTLAQRRLISYFADRRRRNSR